MCLSWQIILRLDKVQLREVIGSLHWENISQDGLERSLQLLEDLDPLPLPLVLRGGDHLHAVPGLAVVLAGLLVEELGPVRILQAILVSFARGVSVARAAWQKYGHVLSEVVLLGEVVHVAVADVGDPILEDDGEGVGSWELDGGEAEGEVPVVRLGPIGSGPDVSRSS